MILCAAEGVRPPERLTVSQAAEKYHMVKIPGAHYGPYSNDLTPYMVEPMDTLTSLDYTGMVFAGPARTGKSASGINWLTYTAICDPTDMMFVHMTQNTARDWSNDDLAKAIRNSPELRRRLLPGKQNDNTHDKRFMSGMQVLIKWPTITELSGKTKGRIMIMDYDRIPENIDGEGNAFDLARKRTQTFKRFGMCFAEGSPGYEVEDPKHIPSTRHEAPPTRGILSLYNRGDRRRWYWDCPQCRTAFEPDFGLIKYPDSEDPMESAEQAVMTCPSCGFYMEARMKQELNVAGRWVKDNMIWLPEENRIVQMNGKPVVRSDIASFWMKGPAAAFQDWSQLVFRYLSAKREFDNTGSEEALKTTINVDQGLPYISQARKSERVPEELKARAEDWGGSEDAPIVPAAVRSLIATVDVQARSFVVQVHGLAAGGDLYVIDGFKIRKSAREDSDGDPLVIDPAAYPEDWDRLIEHVIEKTYPLADMSGRRMAIRFTVCDSGGRAGVTVNALKFWRKLKQDGDGHHKRFGLIKGEHSKTAPPVGLKYPDATRKDRHSGARGDVPMLFLNSTPLKDQLSNLLGKTEPGGGMIHWPSWTPDWFYSQLTTEVRVKDRWENPNNKRNESWDLLYYCLGVLLRRPDSSPFPVFRPDEIDWSDPPSWAAEWDENDFVSGEGEEPSFRGKRKKVNLADLGNDLA
jgi:phage terminase large subunit GpA-like protein